MTALWRKSAERVAPKPLQDEACFDGVVIRDSLDRRFLVTPAELQNLDALVKRPADELIYQVLTKLLKPGAVVFDVGAHVGRFAVSASRIVGASGQVLSFEPIPENYWRLKGNLALNRCENVSVYNHAFSDVETVRMMNCYGDMFSSWSSFGEHAVPFAGEDKRPQTQVEVTCRTLDHFCEEHDVAHIDMLKVDVEGHEPEVFAGAAEMIRQRCIPCICFEISRPALDGRGLTPEDIFKTMSNYGYQCYQYDENKGHFVGAVTQTDLFCGDFFAFLEPPDETGRVL